MIYFKFPPASETWRAWRDEPFWNDATLERLHGLYLLDKRDDEEPCPLDVISDTRQLLLYREGSTRPFFRSIGDLSDFNELSSGAAVMTPDVAVAEWWADNADDMVAGLDFLSRNQDSACPHIDVVGMRADDPEYQRRLEELAVGPHPYIHKGWDIECLLPAPDHEAFVEAGAGNYSKRFRKQLRHHMRETQESGWTYTEMSIDDPELEPLMREWFFTKYGDLNEEWSLTWFMLYYRLMAQGGRTHFRLMAIRKGDEFVGADFLNWCGGMWHSTLTPYYMQYREESPGWFAIYALSLYLHSEGVTTPIGIGYVEYKQKARMMTEINHHHDYKAKWAHTQVATVVLGLGLWDARESPPVYQLFSSTTAEYFLNLRWLETFPEGHPLEPSPSREETLAIIQSDIEEVADLLPEDADRFSEFVLDWLIEHHRSSGSIPRPLAWAESHGVYDAAAMRLCFDDPLPPNFPPPEAESAS